MGRIRIWSGLSLCLAVLGCGPTIRNAVKITPQNPTIDDGGLSMVITPISTDNYKEFGDVYFPLVPGTNWLLGAPAFKVKIHNTNEHIVRFAGSVIKLVDSSNSLHDVMTIAKIKERSRRNLAEHRYQTFTDRVDRKIDSLKILDPSAEVLPGFDGNYYLFFAVPDFGSEQECNDWIASHAPLKVIVFDVVTTTDQAGVTSKKSRFEFKFTAQRLKETWENGKKVSSEPQ